jgi:hypothetical protein
MPATRSNSKTRSPVVIKVEPGLLEPQSFTMVEGVGTEMLSMVANKGFSQKDSHSATTNKMVFVKKEPVEFDYFQPPDLVNGTEVAVLAEDHDYEDEDEDADVSTQNQISKKQSDDKSVLSELEQRRLENIRRNEEYLKSMGFDSMPAFERKNTEGTEKKKQTKAIKRKVTEDGGEENYMVDGFVEPVRRSRRLSKQTSIETADGNAEDSQFIDLDGIVPSSSSSSARKAREPYILDIDLDEDIGREKITAPMLRDYIESKNPQHLEIISNEVSCVHYISNFKVLFLNFSD